MKNNAANTSIVSKNTGGSTMEQETTKVMNAKDYKRAGKAEAVSYIKRRKEAKGEEKKSLVKELFHRFIYDNECQQCCGFIFHVL